MTRWLLLYIPAGIGWIVLVILVVLFFSIVGPGNWIYKIAGRIPPRKPGEPEGKYCEISGAKLP